MLGVEVKLSVLHSKRSFHSTTQACVRDQISKIKLIEHRMDGIKIIYYCRDKSLKYSTFKSSQWQI